MELSGQMGMLCIGILLLVLILQVVQLFRKNDGTYRRERQELLEKIDGARRESAAQQEAFREYSAAQQAEMRKELSRSVNEAMSAFGGLITENMKYSSEAQSLKIGEIGEMQNLRLAENNRRLEQMRETVERKLAELQSDNNRKLDEMRGIVDEKLQKTLNERINESFRMVNERLEQVYRGLGEMQTLAAGVGDLKKVLSNVKTRGILGEVQLGAILQDMLSPEQYERNVAVRKGSQANVEFAVKLPGGDNGPVWLPIDSKFPLDCYDKLISASDKGDREGYEQALRELKDRLKRFAKDIRDKYICPPESTDFAIMFLPSEGLYAEAVRAGMAETLQREYKVSIAGPTTMGALLSSLQMGFDTLAIQKRSNEVWRVLSAVKNEFDSFAAVLDSTQKRLSQANDELDKLVGVRTRKIQNTLKSVGRLSERDEEDLDV